MYTTDITNYQYLAVKYYTQFLTFNSHSIHL